MANNNLSLTKRALLEKWQQGQQPANESPGIPRRPHNSPIKISFPQQHHLFLELLERGTSVNNLAVFLELTGKLDLDALFRSASEILTRHEVLRSRFSFILGLPATDILQDSKITIPSVDLEGIDEKNRVAEARRLAEKEILQPFDLLQAPLIRLKLYRIDNEKYFLLLIAHHVIADGWSLGVFLNELMVHYKGFTSGRPVLLPALPIQYADYAHWQTDEKQQAMHQSSKAYWKKQLGGAIPVLELPTDNARIARQTFKGGTYRFIIPAEQTKALEALSRGQDATLFMTLLTGFYILLHRYCGQDEILVGTPIANRHSPELENLIGVFINTLVLRANLSGDPVFTELLSEVRKVSLEAYAHQDFPFEKLLEELKPKRDLNRPALFQVVFNLQNSPLPELEIPGVSSTFLEIDRGVAQFDLALIISKIKGKCHATVEYNADLFQPGTIARMFASYRLLLDHALKQTGCRISKLQLVPVAELHKIIYEHNKTLVDYPREKCIHQLIEEQVVRTPHAIALIHGEVQLTYSELNRRANEVARRLQDRGVGPEVRVGILMKKSLETIESLLGVLKAGGAYVPIHIASPSERIQFILNDANAQVLLTNIDPGPLDDFKGVVMHLNDEALSSNNNFPDPNVTVRPDNLVYIIYTSGSTGQPKGVMLNHASLVNFLWSMRNSPGMNADSVVLGLASISFDPSTLELFLPLMVGGKVVVAEEGVTKNPLLIAETIDEHGINMVQATPATWQLLLDAGWKGKPGLKALCGGDVMTRKMADQLLERVGNLWNVYGPTETTVWSSLSQIQKGNTPITIGHPIGNLRTYILDRHLQPVPVGVIGELHIAGDGLARAYLNNPELTIAKFIPDIFSNQPGTRLYKSGDLARYLPDYGIELLGRTDDQVKVNGHRMELGELTAVLLQHPSVNDGIVIARTEPSGEKRLVAYFVPKLDPAPDGGELRTFMGKKLPPYMIPAFFMRMDFLPLNSNGKIDRKSLPVPGDNRPHAGYVAPRTEEERLLVKIWENVLGIEQVGIQDNFFDLGGASFQSIEIVAQASMYGFRLSVENIFEYQTIAELTERAMVRSDQ